jgi:hypothetical protein
MMHRKLLIPLGLAAVMTFVGCADEQNQTGELVEEVAPVEQAEIETLEVDLEAVNESGITGNARLTPSDGQTQVELTLSGAAEGAQYTAHIHRGDCGNDVGVVADLGAITASTDEAQLTTTIDESLLDPVDHYFVQVHGADEAPVACANLSGPGFGTETTSPAGAKTAEQGETY